MSVVLGHEFKILVPKQCSCGKPLPEKLRQKALGDIESQLGLWFGGTTTVPGRGTWVDDSRTLVVEGLDVVSSGANAEAYANFREPFLNLTRAMARTLGQDMGACNVDGKLHLEEPMPGVQCVHSDAYEEVPLGPDSMPIYALLARLCKLGGREDLRELLKTLLHFSPENQKIPHQGWPSGKRALLAGSPAVVASHGQFRVVHIHLSDQRLHKDEERAVVGQLSAEFDPDLSLFVFSNKAHSCWHFVYCGGQRAASGALVLRRVKANGQATRRTAVEQLLGIDISRLGRSADASDVARACQRSFSVQAVSDGFFKKYKEVFGAVSLSIEGFADDEDRHLFTQQLFNRLMFLEFVQKKGWLKLNGSTDFLRTLWEQYQKDRKEGETFYHDRLKQVFALLHTPVEDRADAGRGDVPYLNGGLFQPGQWEQDPAVDVPDEAVRSILFELFGKFHFTVSESTPLDQEVAVDPEMLGRVFEELVTGRQEKGSYYTPKPIVQFMCREALKLHLQKSCEHESAEAIAEFVDGQDATAIRDSEAVLIALKNVTACDPACGSGAYLLGMMAELLELRKSLFSAANVDATTVYSRKLDIIQNNVYGVDLDPFAVNIARLRLWLSLAVDFDGPVPEPLPNLEFKVEVGDSVIHPLYDGSSLVEHVVANLRKNKKAYMTARSGEREVILQEIAEDRRLLVSFLPDKTQADAFLWQVDFAEVFASGGFDIVISNPPFVRQELLCEQKPHLKLAHKEVYDGNADLYVYFYSRGLDLLKEGGAFTYISSNKWLRSNYGRRLRVYFAKSAWLQSITDFGELPVFRQAATFPVIVVARKKEGGNTEQVDTFTRTQVASLDEPYPDVLRLVREQGIRVPLPTEPDQPLVATARDVQALIQQMKANSTSLEDYVKEVVRREIVAETNEATVRRGIVTGCNEVFYIGQQERGTITAGEPRYDEIIQPLIVGDDVGRWRIEDHSRFVIFAYRGIDIGRYANVTKYLCRYRRRLEPKPRNWAGPGKWPGRKPGTYKWFEIQDQVNYHKEFLKPKIVFPDICLGSKFAYDESGRYLDNTVSCIPIQDLFLLAVLNSSWVWKYIQATFPFLGDPQRRGRARLKTAYVRTLPIPRVTSVQKNTLAELARRCVDAGGVGCEETEEEIDRIVAGLYGVSLQDVR